MGLILAALLAGIYPAIVPATTKVIDAEKTNELLTPGSSYPVFL